MSATKASAAASQPAQFDFACVLDFEAVCEDGVRLFPQEIIEFPTVLYDIANRRIVDEFHTYVKPQVHTRLTPFCTDLTGITQETVDHGRLFEDVVASHLDWLRSHGLDPQNPSAPGHRFVYVTCGDWDLKSCLPPLLTYFKLASPPCFAQWINIKKAFQAKYGVHPKGMTDMLRHLHLHLVGRHHSGIDDARNIAAILDAMLAGGYSPELTWRPRA